MSICFWERRNTCCKVLFFCLAILGGNPALPRVAASTLPTMNYGLDLELIWIDGLSRPQAPEAESENPAAAPPGEGGTEEPHGGRSLGLRHLLVDLGWALAGQSSLTLRLRPDALLHRHAGLENGVDLRAGQVYRQKRPLVFLERYLITVPYGDNLQGRLGVWEDIPYEGKRRLTPIPFGLKVLLPRRFAGVEMFWNLGGQQNKGVYGLRESSVSLLFFQGREDGGESLDRDTRSFDSAPIAKNPYFGGAFTLEGVFSKALRLEILCGLDESGRSGSRIREYFLGTRMQYQPQSFLKATSLTGEFRYARENRRHKGPALPTLTQKMLLLSGTYAYSYQSWLRLALHWGGSEQVNPQQQLYVDRYSGHQLDLQWEKQVDTALRISMQISEEHRYLENMRGSRQDGFQNSKAQDNILRRVAFALNYVLQG